MLAKGIFIPNIPFPKSHEWLSLSIDSSGRIETIQKNEDGSYECVELETRAIEMEVEMND